MIELLTYIYLIIGVVVALTYWNNELEPQYRIAKQYGETEDGMICIYLMGVVILWPIFIIGKM